MVEGPGESAPEFKRSLLAVPSSVGLARDLAEVQLRKWGLVEVTGEVVLVVSELLTNAVKANPGELVEFEMYLLPGALMIEIWDPSPEPPMPRTAGPDDTSGRGLAIVELITEIWGTRRPPRGGKTVWARLRCDP
ncbi:MAG TPA: ATP-binding protein [Streptosporangiaceae bacterium]